MHVRPLLTRFFFPLLLLVIVGGVGCSKQAEQSLGSAGVVPCEQSGVPAFYSCIGACHRVCACSIFLRTNEPRYCAGQRAV